MEDCRFLLEEILYCSLVFIKRSASQDVNSLTLTAGSLPDYPIVIPFINLNKGCIFIKKKKLNKKENEPKRIIIIIFYYCRHEFKKKDGILGFLFINFIYLFFKKIKLTMIKISVQDIYI